MSKEKFVFYRNTKDRCEDEMEAVLIEQMNEAKHPIAYDTFIGYVTGFSEITAALGYKRGELHVSSDWSVGFARSIYAGRPCLLFEHTECDFIFLRPKDRDELTAAFAEGVAEWARKTNFGKEAR